MPFDPIAWVVLADELAGRDDEAARRAAIGRYYYGLHVRCRISLAEGAPKIAFRLDDSDHREVIAALAKHKRAVASVALKSLRTLRNEADYHEEISIDAESVKRAKGYVAAVRRMCQPDWDAEEAARQ